MRTFFVLSHTAPLTPEFSLDDLPGGAGRLDVLCRYVTAATLLSHGIRDNVRCWIVIQDELTLEFRSEELRHLNPDERSTAALFRSALEVADERAISRRPIESTPGVYVRRQGFESSLDAVGEAGTPIWLSPEGAHLTPASVPGEPVFILSDHLEFTEDERDVLRSRSIPKRSIGPVAVHGNHAIAIAHNRCDRSVDEPSSTST